MDVSVTLTTLLYFVISVALMCYVYMHNFFPPKKVLFTSLVFGFLYVILMKDDTKWISILCISRLKWRSEFAEGFFVGECK